MRRHWMLGVYLAGVVLVTFQFGGRDAANNFKIYRAAFFHLVAGQDIYREYPGFYDVFKYSPTWALLLAPFALPPPAVGWFLWDLTAALIFYFAIDRLLPQRQARLALGIAFFEFLAAMQLASSSNAIIAALIILTFVALERGEHGRAGLATGLGALMKIYPLGAAVFALFHPRKRRYALAVLGAVAALVVLPLLVSPPAALAAQWRSWSRVLTTDAVDRGFSVMQVMYAWLGITWPNQPVQVAGAVLLVLPLLLRRNRWSEQHFRRLFLCSFLLFAVLFNHQVERPSFVVGFTGIAIWYAISPRTLLRHALMVVAFIGVPLLHSDVIPWHVRREVLLPHQAITFPCLLLWLVIQAELFAPRPAPSDAAAPAPALDQ